MYFHYCKRNKWPWLGRFGNTDLKFGDFVEVVLFGGEVEAGHSRPPVQNSYLGVDCG